MLDTARGPKTT